MLWMIWMNHLANDKTCLNCEVGSDSRPEAENHILGHIGMNSMNGLAI